MSIEGCSHRAKRGIQSHDTELRAMGEMGGGVSEFQIFKMKTCSEFFEIQIRGTGIRLGSSFRTRVVQF